MLVIITGARQVGKTRWLERFIESAQAQGFCCVGLISPGIWKPQEDGNFEKLGITGRLLPEARDIPYAVRYDLAEPDAHHFKQSDSARLGWRIYDDAIDTINEHFGALQTRGFSQRDILIVDELGPLELVHGKGFTAALELLENPTRTTCTNHAGESNNNNRISPDHHAVLIMRPELLETIQKRLTPVWGEPLIIDITDDTTYRGIESLISSLSSASDKS